MTRHQWGTVRAELVREIAVLEIPPKSSQPLVPGHRDQRWERVRALLDSIEAAFADAAMERLNARQDAEVLKRIKELVS